MVFRYVLLVFFIYSFIGSVNAQGVRGKVTNFQGDAIAFATIYIPDLSTGSITNSEGKYELKLSPGKHSLLFQSLGYQTQKIEIAVGPDFVEKNVQLPVQDYLIPEIKVLASGEDPALYIMRKAIAMAPYYQKQVSKYSCKVYLKGSGIFEKIPFLFEKQMKKSGIKENEPFVMETVSKIDFELPDKMNQKVLAMRSTGRDNNTSPMPMIVNSLYDAEKYGMISPLGRNALKNYDFKLVSSFIDQGRTINKIWVLPNNKGAQDVFSGYIYIADDYWNIQSAELNFKGPMVTGKMNQMCAEVSPNVYMTVSQKFDIDFSGFGVKMNYKYLASLSEYSTTLNLALDHTFLDKLNRKQQEDQQAVSNFLAKEKDVDNGQVASSRERKKIESLLQKKDLNNRETARLNRLMDEEARREGPPESLEIKSSFQVSPRQVNNDSAYWNKLRPIPLSDLETKSFASKDSFLQVSSRPEYKDSVYRAKRKFKVRHLIFGKTYDYSNDTIRSFKRFTIPALTAPTALSFNSVDGLRVELPFDYFRADSTGHLLRLEPTFSYAFAREKVDVSVAVSKRTNGLTNSWIGLSAGTTTADFNRSTGMSAMNNDFYTLWLEENYRRFYRRDFIELVTSRDLTNGLNLKIALDYSNNLPLSNHSSYTIIDYADKEIMPNIPANDLVTAEQLETHQTFAGQISLEYTPRNRYRIRNNTLIYVGSKYPTFMLSYSGAMPNVVGSDSEYGLLKLGIRQKIDFGLTDHLSYTVSAGKFINSNKLYFEDYAHFNTQFTGFSFASTENSFRLLPFYQYSTNKSFADAHLTWQSRSLLVKQLPVIKNTSVTEKLFMNYLSTPDFKNYLEAGYGISNIFLLLNVEAVAGFRDGRFQSAGIKVSLNLK